LRTYEFAAPRVRHLVADCLRAGDPVELAITLGVEFGIAMPERMLDRVSTYERPRRRDAAAPGRGTRSGEPAVHLDAGPRTRAAV